MDNALRQNRSCQTRQLNVRTMRSIFNDNAPINVKPVAGGGRAWGGDLIVFVGPGVGHLTDPVLPGEGIFESFFARRRDI